MTDRNRFVAGEHTQATWDSVAGTLDEIENLPFLDALATGELPVQTFVNYILQDELYLNGYARAMSQLGVRAPNREDTRFWALAAGEAVTVEEDMHGALLAEERFAPARSQLTGADGQPQPSPTTLGYTSYLIAQAATAAYPVGVAAVLPCFWVYAHMGKVLTERVGDAMDTHPYRAWIETYDSPEFDESVDGAVAILEREMAAADEPTRQAMMAAFAQATVYELHFWASAHIFQSWDVAALGEPAVEAALS